MICLAWLGEPGTADSEGVSPIGNTHHPKQNQDLGYSTLNPGSQLKFTGHILYQTAGTQSVHDLSYKSNIFATIVILNIPRSHYCLVGQIIFLS